MSLGGVLGQAYRNVLIVRPRRRGGYVAWIRNESGCHHGAGPTPEAAVASALKTVALRRAALEAANGKAN